MQTATTYQSNTARTANQFEPIYPPLSLVTRPTVPTAQAAFYLLRRPQTLRTWAMRDDGPIRPIRIGSRLGWPVAEIRRLLGAQ